MYGTEGGGYNQSPNAPAGGEVDELPTYESAAAAFQTPAAATTSGAPSAYGVASPASSPYAPNAGGVHGCTGK